VNEIRLKSIFQLSSHMKSAKFMARGLVTERIFSLVNLGYSLLGAVTTSIHSFSHPLKQTKQTSWATVWGASWKRFQY
jgi:hypothetical protein